MSLVISLDCGIKAIEKIEYAKEKGIDFIICDHHMPDATLPDAVAVLDAKRSDSIYPYEHLSGCGVGFKFMQAFAKSNNFPFSGSGEVVGADGGQYRLGYRPDYGREPHPRLLRAEAIEQQPQPRAERDYRYLRIDRKGDHDQ